MRAELPDDVSLGPVRLRVADSVSSGAWLESRLGLAKLGENEDRSVYGAPRGTPLVELRERPGARRVPRGGLLGLYHYAVLLPSRADLGTFLAHLEETGEPFGASDHLFSEAIYLTDPDGISVEVYADRPRETWRHQGDDLVGALDPLDRAGLLRAAGERRWHGAPEGTRLGHLHFFTDDLARARRFHVEGLGFAVSTRLFAGALFVAAAGYHHHVGLNVWAAGQPVSGEGDAGLDAWTLRVPGAEARARLAGRLRALEVDVREEGGTLLARDPWGVTVRVVG